MKTIQGIENGLVGATPHARGGILLGKIGVVELEGSSGTMAPFEDEW